MTAQHSTVSVEWYTPPEIIEPIRAGLGGIKLDVASSSAAQAIVGAERWRGLDHDPVALSDVSPLFASWLDVEGWFLNPPTPAVDWWRMVRVQSRRPGAFVLFNIDQLPRCEGWSECVLVLPRKRIRYLAPIEHVRELDAARFASRLEAWERHREHAISLGRKVRQRPEPAPEVAPGLGRGPSPPHASAILGVNMSAASGSAARFAAALSHLGEIVIPAHLR